MKCPSECGYKGNAIEVDAHQVYNCPKRLIKCPNENCEVKMVASEMEKGHLQSCPLLMVHCPTCFLPVKVEELETHDCMGKLMETVKSMSNNFF